MSSRNTTKMAWLAALSVLCVVVFFAGRDAWAETAQPTATVGLEVKGMSCDSCANTIKTELESMEGVIKADVSFERSNAVVQYRPSKVEPERLIRKIRQIGYRAKVKKSG